MDVQLPQFTNSDLFVFLPEFGQKKRHPLRACVLTETVAFVQSRSARQLDTLRENCGIIRKQASTDGGVLWEVVRVNVVQVR
ncbi:hypothetical protein TNCV_2116021 [Trichonephila clavipes]|nr:hypothetical protein TNCV_2116021 [Trichonephila clavipes]